MLADLSVPINEIYARDRKNEDQFFLSFLIEMEFQRGVSANTKRGMQDVFLFHKNLYKAVLRSISLIPQKVDENDFPLSKASLKIRSQLTQKRRKCDRKLRKIKSLVKESGFV